MNFCLMKKISYYWNLFTTDRTAFRYQLWMVWNRRKIQCIQWLSNVYANRRHTFLTIHKRPTESADIHTWDDLATSPDPKIAIVMQGPLVSNRNFTKETVLLYKKYFPNSNVIVSTWEDEDPTTITSIKEAGADVVLNTKPTVSGIGNVNFQLISTLGGMKRAQVLGAEFVYKTRSDERIYAPNTNRFLVQLLRSFPVAPGYSQKYRIVGSSFGTLKYVPYLFTDVFQFGHIDDMVRYWSAAHDPRSKPSKMIHAVSDLNDEKMCEQYLSSTYLTSIGRTLPWTIQDWWRVIADHFIIADQSSLDIFFYKYDFFEEHRGRRYDGISNNAYVTFSDWLTFYNQKDTLPAAPEHWLHNGRHAVMTKTDTITS